MKLHCSQDIRDKLEDRLVSQNRWDWFHEEVAPRVTYEYYAPPSPQDLWVKSLKPHKLVCFKEPEASQAGML